MASVDLGSTIPDSEKASSTHTHSITPDVRDKELATSRLVGSNGSYRNDSRRLSKSEMESDEFAMELMQDLIKLTSRLSRFKFTDEHCVRKTAAKRSNRRPENPEKPE